MSEVECIYCGCDVPDDGDKPVPTWDDDEQWDYLADFHRDDCEWILTRAHQLSEEVKQ